MHYSSMFQSSRTDDSRDPDDYQYGDYAPKPPHIDGSVDKKPEKLRKLTIRLALIWRIATD